MLVTANQLLAI